MVRAVILDSRGHESNGNGVDLTERQRQKLMLQSVNMEECNEIAHAHAVKAMNHLGNQIPGLFKAMMEQAITAALTGYHQSLVERGVIPPEEATVMATPVRPESPDSRENTEPSDSGGDSD